MHQDFSWKQTSLNLLATQEITFSSMFGLRMAALKRSAGETPPRSPSRVAGSFSSAERPSTGIAALKEPSS